MPPPFSSSSRITATTSASSSSNSSPSSVLSIVPMDVLHFDVPLISTRRASSGHELNQLDPSPDTSRRVPFLWERAPGIPKDSTINKSKSDEDYTPKPPPGRWRPPNLLSGNGGDYASGEADDDAFSDALDKMSLSESFGVPCRLSVSKDTGPSVARAPSFIMKRFLPAANALAASSAAANALPRYPNRKVRSGSTDMKNVRSSQMRMTEVRKIQYDYGHETMPGRACGIMLLFPWGTKRAVCGLKSPVRCQTPKRVSIGPIGGGDYGPGSDDGLSSRAWKSPGWGLPFLDTSRLRRPKGKSGTVGFGEGSPRRRRRDVGGFNEVGRQLPRLKTPSEPWLANALSSVNRRRP